MYSEQGKDRGHIPGAPEHRGGALFFFASTLPYNRRDIDTQKEILAEEFSSAGWEVRRLLDAMWRAPDFYFDTVSQVQMPRWSRGRAALLRDAAYGPPRS
jgi:2-polyprenyl-6-methoxyphenol hydroxylase-like FAD-dependent oxidoreductase